MAVEVRDLGYKAIVKSIKKLDGSHTSVGLWGDGQGPDENLAARGAVHEYGSRKVNIPSRPFNRKAFDDNLRKLKEVITDKYNQMLDRRLSPEMVLNKVGDWFAGVVRETITTGSFKALKSSTIKTKGSTKPLIDTADMRDRITHKEYMK